MILTLSEFRTLALSKHPECPDCGEVFRGPVEHYSHPDGWRVADFGYRLWLYLTCARCRYGWSLWKLGIERSASDDV